MAANGNPKGLLIAIGALVVVGAGASFMMMKSQTQEGAPSAETAPTETSPAMQAVPTEAVQPPTTGGAPTDTSAPAAALDLTVDAEGLSKTTVVITTSKGVIKYKFYPNEAPNTVKRIAELIQKGFYNGLGFHRVVPGFVIQGGDPKGDGTGGSGQNLKAEFNSRKHVPGAVAMARAQDPDSADSQFYISLGTHPHLDNSYTVFGKVVEGMDVVEKIAVGDRMTSVTLQ